MVDLAVNAVEDQVALKNIAERQNISDAYLENIFSTLRKAGLVKSIKGAQGGYILGRSPKHITVGQVLRVMEGDLSIVNQEKNSNSQNNIENCLNTSVWEVINESINEIVDSITLDKLVEKYKKLEGSAALMYYI